MNIRNMAIRKNFDKQGQPVSLEFILELSDHSMISVVKSLPITTFELPYILHDVGLQLQQLIIDKDK